MNFTKEMSALLEGLPRLIESPKTTVAASTASATVGIAVAGQWLNSFAGWLAVVVGVVATGFLARVHWFKSEQHRLEIEHQRLENEILKKKARELGVAIEED